MKARLKLIWAFGALAWILFGSELINAMPTPAWRGVFLGIGTVWIASLLVYEMSRSRSRSVLA